VVNPTIRPISPAAVPDAARRTIRARWLSRCCVFFERAKPESSVCSSSFNRIEVAAGILFKHS
jgi:hypothetical protein